MTQDLTFYSCPQQALNYCHFISSLILFLVPKSINMLAKGNGMLADMYRSVAKALKPLGLEMHMDTLPCLPIPSPPDWYRYKQICKFLSKDSTL